ncbi:MAG: carbon-nitrogen hydrolase family protein [Patescibacteria group bacterium]
MENKFNVAIVQFEISHLNPAENLRRAESFIAEAAQKNAQVIVFPEDFMTGSIFGDLRHLDRDHNFLQYFQTLARKYHIDIISGSWMEETPNGAFSTTSYIDYKGNVLGEYHKNHLYLSERNFLKPGTNIAVFDTRFGRAGLIICWDIMYPEIFARMNELGVQIVYCVSYWYKEITGDGAAINPNAEEAHIDALCLARAVENNVAFIYANAAGTMHFSDNTSDCLIGHSQINLPIAGTIAKLGHNQEGMLMALTDISVLNTAREIYKIREY